MNISPDEAQEALTAIQDMTHKTRRSIASGGTSLTLIVTGIVWLVGFACTQFLSGAVVAYIWIGLSLLGSAVAIVLGRRMGERVHSPLTAAYAKRIGVFWLLLVCYGIATIAVAQPLDGKQVTTLVILFIMLGQLSMGMLTSFSSVWWALPISALALAGYYLMPDYFYLLMAILGGGGMIALGLYIRSRW